MCLDRTREHLACPEEASRPAPRRALFRARLVFAPLYPRGTGRVLQFSAVHPIGLNLAEPWLPAAARSQCLAPCNLRCPGHPAHRTAPPQQLHGARQDISATGIHACLRLHRHRACPPRPRPRPRIRASPASPPSGGSPRWVHTPLEEEEGQLNSFTSLLFYPASNAPTWSGVRPNRWWPSRGMHAAKMPRCARDSRPRRHLNALTTVQDSDKTT